ncbi:hypothetical protein ACKWTF_013001 [Chironomus riparius]
MIKSSSSTSLSQQAVELIKSSTSPQPSSLKCKYSNSSKSEPQEHFNWNREQIRHNSEYVDGKFSKPFNNIAPELRVIGGLGPIKCLNKKKGHPKVVNRPTQVQKISHTTTKLLLNFNFTEQLKTIVCERTKHMSVDEHVEKVKITENLPITDEASIKRHGIDTIKSFKHENPFNLDFNALSEYQKQRSNAEDAQRRRNSQIVRRTMETKKLKTEGAERIKQDERNEKFGLPAFFRISHDDDEMMVVETAPPTSPSTSSKYKCGVIPMLDKPKNKEIVKLHYQHKEDKLRQRIQMTKIKEEALAKEIEEREKEAKENLIFRLVDESFPPSEHHSSTANDAEDASNDKIKFDYRESGRLSQSCKELVENSIDDEISCGQKIGKCVILRGFHDRLYSEPRGKSNLYRVERTTNDSCRTHKEWLQTITNDPKIVNSPPKGKILSSIKGACDPNDDKTFLFNDKNESNKMMMTKIKKSSIMKNIKSPIKQHIKEIDKKLKQKYLPRMKKSLKSQIDVNEIQKRYQRMKFMGIPTMEMSEFEQTNDNERTYRMNQETVSTHDEKMKGEKHNNDDKLTSKGKHSNTITTPEAIKLIPKIPSSSCSDMTEDECEQSKVVGFTKAHPRGNNPELLRIDKSLPWIYNEINSAKVKFQIDYDEMNRKSYNVAIDNWNHVSIDIDGENKKKEIDENQSEIKRSFNSIIASKRKHYMKSVGIELNDGEDDNAHATVDKDYDTKSMQSASTLSSTGTYFTNDSGSHIVILNEEIPKSRVNIGKKFQNHSLVTTKSQPSFDSQPYFITDLHTMKKLHKPSDRFHTQRTRSCANIRERVKVDSLDYEDELIGTEKNKKKSLLATDIDESYVKELYNERSRTEFRFKRVSEVKKMREGFMRKIEAYYIKEKMMVDKIQAENDIKAMKELTETVNQYEKFLDEQKKTRNHDTMKIMKDVKQYYIDTDKLRAEHEVIRVQVGPMNMKIFYIGNEFLRMRRYQDFQYLLMPLEWRLKHDHLHLDYGDGSLETPILEDLSKSIHNRSMKNAWDQANASVQNIMEYINNIYCINEPKKLFPFKKGKDMIGMIEVLNSKSIKLLSKLMYVAIISNKLDDELRKLNFNNEKFITNMEFKAQNLEQRFWFLEQRSTYLLNKSKELAENPLEESYKDPLLNELKGYCKILFKTIIYGYKIDEKNSIDDSKIYTTIDQFQKIEDKVLNMFVTIDKIPQKLFNEMEQKVRKERERKFHLAERACRIEDNIDTTMKQLQRLFADPPKKEKIIGKLQRLYLKKKPQRIIKEKPLLSPLEEEYLKAFMDVSDDKDVSEAKFDPNVKLMIEKIKNESTPFYVDRFIESLGINLKKLDPQDVEMIVQDEAARMKFKDMLPAIRMKMKYWEFKQKMEKEKNIQKTYFLYQKK